jgi:hypothetical protein
MNLAKSLIVSEKNFFNHRAPMQWNGSFWPKISPNFAYRQGLLIRYTRRKHAVHSYLRTRTTDHSEYWWVILLIICWNFEYVNSLSLRDTHRFKNSKYWISRTFAVKKGIFHPVGTPRLIHWPNKGRRMLPNSRPSMESNCRPQLDLFGCLSWKFSEILSI